VSGLEEDAVAESETVVDEGFARWLAGFDDMLALVAGRFAQADSRARGRKYLLGLLSAADRRNSCRWPSRSTSSAVAIFRTS
jgi:hypothetical protein